MPIAWEPADGRSDASSVRGQQTREKILRSAIVMFGRHGFAETTVLDIAEHAHLASGTVYQYFEDKSDIFRCLLAELTGKLRSETRMPADEDGRLMTRDSVMRYIEVYREYSSIFRTWWELLEPPTEFTVAWTALHERSRGEMIDVVTAGQKAAIIDKNFDPEITADLIVAMFERPLHSRLVLGWNEEVSDEEIADLISRLLGSGLGS